MRAFHALSCEPKRFTDSGQALQRCAFTRHIGELTQFAQRHVNAVVATNHRKARGTAVHLFRLLHELEAADHVFVARWARPQIDYRIALAPFRKLYLTMQLAVSLLNSLCQRFAGSRVLLQNEMHGTVRHYEKHRIGFGDDAAMLTLAQQTGFFTKNAAATQGSERILGVAVVMYEADFAAANDVQPPVIHAVLLQDGRVCLHALYADALEIRLYLARIHFAAQVEHSRNQAAQRSDCYVFLDERLRIPIPLQNGLY